MDLRFQSPSWQKGRAASGRLGDWSGKLTASALNCKHDVENELKVVRGLKLSKPSSSNILATARLHLPVISLIDSIKWAPSI